jgi:hypothetical protein
VQLKTRTDGFGIEGEVILEVRNGENKIMVYEPHMNSTGMERASLVIGQMGWLDGMTAERLAEAFSHLIEMFGGKKEAF